MKTILYTKLFLTGTLRNLTVAGKVTFANDRCKMVVGHRGKDYGTGAKWIIVESREVNDEKGL